MAGAHHCCEQYHGPEDRGWVTGTLQRPTPRLWLEGEYEEAENCSENIEAAHVLERRDQPQCDWLSLPLHSSHALLNHLCFRGGARLVVIPHLGR